MPRRKLRLTEAAWLAGIIDGEGCFHARRRKTTGWMRCEMMVAMLHAPTIQRIQHLAGGGVCIQVRVGKRPCYRWSLSNNDARWLIPQLLPFLVTKKDQAQLYLLLLKHTTPPGMSLSAPRERRQDYLIRELTERKRT